MRPYAENKNNEDGWERENRDNRRTARRVRIVIVKDDHEKLHEGRPGSKDGEPLGAEREYGQAGVEVRVDRTSRCWAFTAWRPDIDWKKVEENFIKAGGKRILVGREYTADNRLHWQGWLKWGNARRFGAIKSLVGDNSMHCEIMASTEWKNDRYCRKDGDVVVDYDVTKVTESRCLKNENGGVSMQKPKKRDRKEPMLISIEKLVLEAGPEVIWPDWGKEERGNM